MLDNPEGRHTEIDVDAMMEKIRKEVARRKGRRGAGPFSEARREAAGGVTDASGSVNMSSIRSSITLAEAQADVGTEVTPMLQFRGIVRRMALLAGRVVLFLSSFITFKQRIFNGAAVASLRNIADGLETLNGELVRLQPQTGEALNQIESLRHGQTEVREEQSALRSLVKRQEEELSALRNRLREQKMELASLRGSLALVIEETRKSLREPSDRERIESIVKEEDHLLNTVYVSLEDKFRGTREEIRERLKIYLPYVERATKGLAKNAVLDIGCGRGEWLELLQENGYDARGIDLNRLLVDNCQQKGLDVIEAEAVTYLWSLPDASVDVVTGFHIIEHLPFKTLISFLDQVVRVLKPGGMAIFETPNPENVIVSTHTFYLDPTHLKPMPAQLTDFLLVSRGLTKVEILYLNPYFGPHRVSQVDTEVAQRFNNYFFGPRDYAAIGYK
jgi:2-polyprenyl-3-methyl-5-hydroxy-6-metoxy-1,4-benzoquinol methylase